MVNQEGQLRGSRVKEWIVRNKHVLTVGTMIAAAGAGVGIISQYSEFDSGSQPVSNVTQSFPEVTLENPPSYIINPRGEGEYLAAEVSDTLIGLTLVGNASDFGELNEAVGYLDANCGGVVDVFNTRGAINGVEQALVRVQEPKCLTTIFSAQATPSAS